MSAENFITGRTALRPTTRVVAVPVSLLPISGIIILVGFTYAILRLTITG